MRLATVTFDEDDQVSYGMTRADLVVFDGGQAYALVPVSSESVTVAADRMWWCESHASVARIRNSYCDKKQHDSDGYVEGQCRMLPRRVWMVREDL